MRHWISFFYHSLTRQTDPMVYRDDLNVENLEKGTADKRLVQRF